MANKGFLTRALVLVGSMLAAVSGLVIIREADRGRLIQKKIDSQRELVAVPEAVLANQKIISDYREQKFKEITTAAKETKVNAVTTTTTGKAQASSTSSSGSGKKKSSSGSNSSGGSVTPAPAAPKAPSVAPAPAPAPAPKPAPAPAPTPPPVTRTS